MNVTTNKVQKSLKVQLTDAEKLDAAEKVGKELQLTVEARERKKEVTADLTSAIEQHRTAAERLGNLLANGYEYRTVECTMTVDRPNDRVKVVRLDTDETVEDRSLFPHERQGEMELQQES